MKKQWNEYPKTKPVKEGYYKVRFKDGTEDMKPFRIRPSKNINGFMTEETVTHYWS